MAKLISGVYGEALYDTAVSSGSSDEMMEEIGVIMGVTRERIRQIEAKGLRLLAPKLSNYRP